MNVVKVGEPIGVFYGAEYAGVDPNNGDALWYINAQDASGNIANPTATTNDFTEANLLCWDNRPLTLSGQLQILSDIKELNLHLLSRE